MKILFVAPSLAYGGTARQLALLAAGLPRRLHDVRVFVLGPGSAWGDQLRSAGIPVATGGWTRLFDPRPLARLRALVQEFRPELIHAWGARAVQATALVAGRVPVVVSRPLPDRPGARPPPLDRWLLGRARAVIARGEGEQRRLERQGLAAGRIRLIPPAVPDAVGAAGGLRRSLGLSADDRLVACVGPVEQSKGFRDAVWAFDILQFLFDDLHLIMIGDGPYREELRRFARAIGVPPRIHWVNPPPDVPGLLADFDVVWVPSRAGGGSNVVLEAMAAGRPVVATPTGDLAAIVADGQTGYIVAAGDKVALARRTRRLLDDPALRRRLGDAGRRRARERFRVADLVRRHAEVYEGAAGFRFPPARGMSTIAEPGAAAAG